MDKYQTLREKDNPSNNVFPNIKTQNIPDGAITTAKIADYNITESKLASNSVSTGKILNSSITNDKLSANSVSTSKVQDGSITIGKLGLGNDELPSAKLAITDSVNVHPLSEVGGDGLQNVCEWLTSMMQNPRFIRFVNFIQIDEVGAVILYHVDDSSFDIEVADQGTEQINTQADCTTFYASYADSLCAVLL